MRMLGFSTGAIAKGDFDRALQELAQFHLPAVEVSALRLDELPRLAQRAPCLDLAQYRYVSVHAPSYFEPESEQTVVDLLQSVVVRGWPVVVHPDVIFTDALWLPFGEALILENSDRRKTVGRTADEIESLFDRFPDARFCFDVGHARQIDPTMNEAQIILERNRTRLLQVHISEVNFLSRHDPLSSAAIEATRRIAHFISEDVPIIVETSIDHSQSTIMREVRRAMEALTPLVRAAV
jgi:hypothetical protein